MLQALHIKDTQLASRFVIDYDNPDFIVMTRLCLTDIKEHQSLKHYISHNKDAIFIIFCEECLDPDLNVFDYAVIWNKDIMCADRIAHNLPSIWRNNLNDTLKNELSSENARKLLASRLRFCNFIYSHACEPRDTFFHMLSQYRHVDSSGKHLNNTNTRHTRNASNWYDLSIDMKRGYKFSIAMENQSYKGYTTEKIISSLQAHTVPIYWGDPAVTDYINPKAFINCGDYSSLDEVVERVKEIDSNDDLWLDMVTQPWQTDEQYARTLQHVAEYENFTHNIFSQDIHSARRRPEGSWGKLYRKKFTGLIGMQPPFYVKLFRRMRHFLGMNLPDPVIIKIKKLLHKD